LFSKVSFKNALASNVPAENTPGAGT